MTTKDHTHDFKDQLKEKKLKITSARLAVLEILCTSEKALSVDNIQTKLKKDSPDLATIYRIVDIYIKAELIHEVILKDGIIRYESSCKDHQHHITCTDCGVMENITDPLLEKALIHSTKKSKKFRMVKDHSVEFFGYCLSCAKKPIHTGK